MEEKKEKKVDLAALSQVIDSSWTRSNASSGPVMSTHSIKCSFLGENKIKIMYITVVNMVRDRELRESCVVYEKEADTIIEAAAKKIASEYKEITEKSLKLKRESIDSNIEIIDLNHFNQKRSAYLRRIAVFEVS